MTIIACLSMVRPNDRPRSYWGDNEAEPAAPQLQSLVVVVSTIEENPAALIAYGVDPATSQLVFTQLVPTTQLGTLFRYIADGEPTHEIAAVDVPVPQPRPTGPKVAVMIDYAMRFGAPLVAGPPASPSVRGASGAYPPGARCEARVPNGSTSAPVRQR